ncbi:MAG: thiamine diphosphokinase [Christensenellales bacterium]
MAQNIPLSLVNKLHIESESEEKTRFCHIVGASVFTAEAFLAKRGDLVIAADAGLNNLRKIDAKADIILGDFDSLGFVPEGAILLPKEKDDTDTMYAIKLAMEKGFRYFILHGCLGGRFDHSLANLQGLIHISQKGGRGYLIGEGYAVAAITNGEIRFAESAVGYISVFSGHETARGVNIVGLKYPLRDYSLQNSMPIGVSNEFAGQKSAVQVKDGTLLIVWQTGFLL